MTSAYGPARTDRLAAVVAARRVWLLDLDGTLVDSDPLHAAAFQEALAQVAPALAGSLSYRQVAGSSTRTVVADLGVDADTADVLVRHKQRVYRGYVEAGRVPVRPGAHRLLVRLAHSGRTSYLVTSGSRGSVGRVLAACRLASHFHGVLTADDLPWSKPDPRVYREACRRWGVDPGDAVVLEDSAHGVSSAVGAGLTTLQVHTAEPAPGALAVPSLDALASLLGPVRGADG